MDVRVICQYVILKRKVALAITWSVQPLLLVHARVVAALSKKLWCTRDRARPGQQKESIFSQCFSTDSFSRKLQLTLDFNFIRKCEHWRLVNSFVLLQPKILPEDKSNYFYSFRKFGCIELQQHSTIESFERFARVHAIVISKCSAVWFNGTLYGYVREPQESGGYPHSMHDEEVDCIAWG